MSEEHAGGGRHVLLAQQIANAHAKLLVVETVQDRLDVFGRPAKLLERLPQALPRWQSVPARGCPSEPSSIPGLLMRMPDRYGWKNTVLTYSLRRGAKLNSSHSTPLPPNESLTLARLTSVESGSGVAAMASSSCGTMAARKWRQRRVERKRIFSVDIPSSFCMPGERCGSDNCRGFRNPFPAARGRALGWFRDRFAHRR